MNVGDFEAMIARAEYSLGKRYGDEEGQARRMYVSAVGPLINVPMDGDEVDDLLAATIEAFLDEEGYFKK